MDDDADLDAKVEAARAKYGKAGGVRFNGHSFVFKKPSRDHVREYRRKVESAAEKMDAMDQLAQATIVALDEQDDPTAARTIFTTVFLEEYPMATSNSKFNVCLSALSGLTEVEDDEDMGKGVIVKVRAPKLSPKVSPNGSDASSTVAK
jgi:hypothetical protein